MTHPLRDPVQHHADAINQLVEQLFMKCSDRLDDEFDRCIQALIESFDRYTKQQRTYQYPEDLLLDDGLSRNYLVAQQTALLLFANRVTVLSERESGDSLRLLVQHLWDDLSKKYQMFFSVQSPADGQQSDGR